MAAAACAARFAWLKRLAISLVWVAGAARGLAQAAEPPPPTIPPGKKAAASAEFFGDGIVRVFQIELTPAGLDSVARSPRTYVSGRVKEGGKVYTNVAVHLKGMGSFRPVDDKPSFALKFNQFVTHCNYRGMTRLMLNNSVQDGGCISELLATGLFRDAGVPAARVAHARVLLNGRDLGLYTAIEAMNKPFLKHWFVDHDGNLYEGYLRDITSRLEQDNGADSSQSDVRALLAACRVADAAPRFQRLSQRLDVDRFASFAAMEMLTAHWDGYTLKANNYRVYHDPTSDRMVFIPHGMDAAFRRLNVPVTPPMRSTVSRALFETPAGRQGS